MRRTFILLAIAMTMACTATAQKVDKKLYARALGYFNELVQGRSGAVPSSLRKHRGDSLTVWRAWQEAMRHVPDNVLTGLVPLGEDAKGVWSVPDSLEPGATLNYYYGSKAAAGTEALPLFIYLHGSGPREMEWATGLRICSAFDDGPSAYFIPQIPQEGEWYRWYQVSKQWFIERVLRQSLARGDVDPWRIYLFGISEGGYGSQRLASFYADYLAGAGPMAGGEPLKNAPVENCGHIAFSLLTGANDYGFYRNQLTQLTLMAFDSLQVLHPGEYTHRIGLLEGYGHSIDYSLTTPWLKGYRRDAYPRHFIWEDYEMDGRHREGFYNLLVNERPVAGNELRTRYEMSISDNVVELSVDDVSYTCTTKDPQWGIELRFARSYTPSQKGRVTIFLNRHLADLSKPVTVRVNGRELYHATPVSSADAMVRSLAAFGDPLRIFPVAIDINIAE